MRKFEGWNLYIDIFDNYFKNINFNIEFLKPFKKIFVLISGGFDSTLLAEWIFYHYPEKTYFVNCYNPYENSNVLEYYRQKANFIEVRPMTRVRGSDGKYIRGLNGEYITIRDNLNYGKILKESFNKLPKARELKANKKYHKKVFPCCYHIKHKHFYKYAMFKENNTVIISGIKRGDGSQRRIWLLQMSRGTNPRNQSEGKPTFFHKHKTDILYCYPFRDHTTRELDFEIKDLLYDKFPTLEHSGCQICPVLVLFNLTREGIRYEKSVDYAKKLDILEELDDGSYNIKKIIYEN